jgi:hypothetical protein
LVGSISYRSDLIKLGNGRKFGQILHCALIIAVEKVCKDSTLFIDGVQQENWQFEETLLDSEHSVCTAIQKNFPESPQEVAAAIPNSFQSPQEEPIVIANNKSSENNFSLLTCESLLSAMPQPITQYSTEENEAWKDFCQKFDKKPF